MTVLEVFCLGWLAGAALMALYAAAVLFGAERDKKRAERAAREGG